MRVLGTFADVRVKAIRTNIYLIVYMPKTYNAS